MFSCGLLLALWGAKCAHQSCLPSPSHWASTFPSPRLWRAPGVWTHSCGHRTPQHHEELELTQGFQFDCKLPFSDLVSSAFRGWPGCPRELWSFTAETSKEWQTRRTPKCSHSTRVQTPSAQWQSAPQLTRGWKWVETHTGQSLSRMKTSHFLHCPRLLLSLVPLWALSPLLAGTLKVLIRSGEHLQQPLFSVCLFLVTSLN